MQNRRPSDLSAWGMHCFSPHARRTPHSIVRLDDNGMLLASAADWVDLAALRQQGFAVSGNQLRVLTDYGLIDQAGGRIRTAFPVLTSETLTPLRHSVAETARVIVDDLGVPIHAIRELLETAASPTSLYSLVFGHALDGALWTRLDERGVLPSVDLDVEHPFWRGTFWVVETPFPGSAGTNFVRLADATLVLVWTDAVAEPIAALMREPQLPAFVAAALRDETINGLTEFESAERQLVADGRNTVTVIAAGDALDGHCADIVDTVLAHLEEIPPPVRSALAGIESPVQSVIHAHELIWALNAELTARGMVELPPVLATGFGPIRDLIFLISC